VGLLVQIDSIVRLFGVVGVPITGTTCWSSQVIGVEE
jgi:hypothetical protein